MLIKVQKAQLLVFRVYYERPMVLDSLNLKLRKILVKRDFGRDVVCFLEIFLIAQHEEKPLYYTYGNFSFNLWKCGGK